MSVGRISYHKFIEYIKLIKFKNINIPIKKNKYWYFKCKDFLTKNEFVYKSDIESVFSEYSNNSLVYYYCYGNRENILLDKRYAVMHEHSFPDIIEMLYEFPETFYIPTDCKKYYSEQEINFLNNLQEKLLNDGLKDVGIYYQEHPLKEKYELLYLEYNYDELRKRNMKKVERINIKKHEKMYKKITN